MIIKSYEITKKKLDNFYLFLFYGENEGLKKDLINSIINKNNKEQKINNSDYSVNAIFS